VTPDTFAFERDGLALVDRSTGKKPIRIAVDADGTLRERPLDAATASTPSADEPVAREVARLALQAERLFPGPVDVEWAFDGERVWLLQARPVTTIASGRAAAASDAAPPAVDTAPVVWSNVNTGEILPDVASPMTWSIIHGHAQQVFGGMFDALGVHVDAPRLVGLVGGRIYFNLSLLQESVAHLPQLDVTATLGGMQDYIELPEAAAARRPGLLPALRAGIALPGYVLGHTPRRAERFLARMRAENDRAAAVLAAEPGAPEVAALVHGLLDDFDEFNESLAFMMVAMIGFGALARQCKKWFGDESGALANRLVAGAGGVVSAESGHALWRLAEIARSSPPVCSSLAEGAWTDVRARLEGADGVAAGPAAEFLAAWDAFMTEHGHHRRGELEFANPTWAETPDYVLGVVRGYLARAEGDDPIAEYAARAAEADAAAATCRGRLRDPVRRAVFDRLLRWGRSSAAMRENVKSQDVRWLVAIRLALLALADRLVEDGVLAGREDIFFLTMEEIDPVVAEPQSQDWRAIVAARRAERVRLSKLNPPPVVIGDWDEASPAWDVGSGSRELKGMCVSAGVARGRARVFLTADTDETVLPGEILVAPFTDPGWTPYFVPAAGIVMDMGGLLSHGSIIAREYGIPAVVNVGPATRLISTGQMIEVDGDAGVVRILD
jgi:pyruvate,water dikinase